MCECACVGFGHVATRYVMLTLLCMYVGLSVTGTRFVQVDSCFMFMRIYELTTARQHWQLYKSLKSVATLAEGRQIKNQIA